MEIRDASVILSLSSDPVPFTQTLDCKDRSFPSINASLTQTHAGRWSPLLERNMLNYLETARHFCPCPWLRHFDVN